MTYDSRVGRGEKPLDNFFSLGLVIVTDNDLLIWGLTKLVEIILRASNISNHTSENPKIMWVDSQNNLFSSYFLLMFFIMNIVELYK